MPLSRFHPAVREWFTECFDAPTACQKRAWPAIGSGSHTLIAAPTGSGKTLAAFLSALDALVRQATDGDLPDQTQVVYVSPLKALSNDIQRNLEQPLEAIASKLADVHPSMPAIRTMVRTGDTPKAARAAMRKYPPHILVTTPESLYILLTSEGGRAMLRQVRSVIVDEIHATAGSKRGAHLGLSLERLEHLTGRRLVRVGLSATQRPIEDVAHFLVGHNDVARCTIIDMGHVRDRDLALELPNAPLEAVMAGEVWAEIYDRLAALVEQHRTTLVFVNTRRLAERVARHLSERLGEEHVCSHHGSLSAGQRHRAEQMLKSGGLRVLVATASLELGIDIGDVDLVCQLGSTRSISTFLQRVGRSGHGVDALPKGRLFPLSRDDLVECVALLDASRRGLLDTLIIPPRPLDVLAQQVVAMVACGEWSEDELYECITRAYSYRDLSRSTFEAVLDMLARGFSTRRGRRGAYVHRDVVNRELRPRRGSRLTAITCGGAIPDTADYDVILEPEGSFVGTLNEDFAIESSAGDIFQLGNNSWRILRVESGRVRVADAHGLPPTIPFWFGEAPGRTDELSDAVSELRAEIATRLCKRAHEWTGVARDCEQRLGVCASAAEQLVEYLAAAQAALGTLPTKHTIVLERFFDESGGMQLVIHSCYGSRINRAWGLALRKRFCRKFNFELQAAATEDAIVLSLGETHSFALEDVAAYLSPKTARDVLTQALLDAPMFDVRWRWNSTISLAVPRFRGGKKVPPQLQRMQAEDLVAVVFPDQIACAENIPGKREIPDHPLVEQTIRDALCEAMDIDGFETLLQTLVDGTVTVLGRDLTEPSPLAQEILNAKPYAFLDDAPLEERRTRAVLSRRWLDPQTASDLGRLDTEAIARVRDEAWPETRNADELHDALGLVGYICDADLSTNATSASWHELFDRLRAGGRATRFEPPSSTPLWIAAERLPEWWTVHPTATADPSVQLPTALSTRVWTREEALVEIIRSRLDCIGPTTALALAEEIAVSTYDVDVALIALESQGFVLRGQFTGQSALLEWCERRLLARVHRYTVKRLRREIEPVSTADYMRFLFDWQHVAPNRQVDGPSGLASVIEQLEGLEVPASAWENEVLAARVENYEPVWLDSLCAAGKFSWCRLSAGTSEERRSRPIRTTPIALLGRKRVSHWMVLFGTAPPERSKLSNTAQRVYECLSLYGASFFEELVDATDLAPRQAEDALGELASAGLVSSDSFTGLRALLQAVGRRSTQRRPRVGFPATEDAGRWVRLIRRQPTRLELDVPSQPASWCSTSDARDPEALEVYAWTLLRRYGVVFKRLTEREPARVPWRDLLRVLRRLEARGEIRGGRFVGGMAGEQFASIDAVGALRDIRRRPKTGELVSLSGADPLNLTGCITPGERLAALTGNRVLYKDGKPIAHLAAKEVKFLERLDPGSAWDTRSALLRQRMPTTSQSPAGRQ